MAENLEENLQNTGDDNELKKNGPDKDLSGSFQKLDISEEKSTKQEIQKDEVISEEIFHTNQLYKDTPQLEEPTRKMSLQDMPQEKPRSMTLQDMPEQGEPTRKKSLQDMPQEKPRSMTLQDMPEQGEPTRTMSLQNILGQDKSTRRMSLLNMSRQDKPTRKQFVKDLSKKDKDTRDMFLDSMTQDKLTQIFRKDMFQDKDTRDVFMNDVSRKAEEFITSLSKQDDPTLKDDTILILENMSKYEATRKMFLRDVLQQDEVTRKQFLKVMSQSEDTQNMFIKDISQQDEATRNIFLKDLSKFDEIRKVFLQGISQQDETTRIMCLNDLSRQDEATRKVFLKDILKDKSQKDESQGEDKDEATRNMFINDMSRRADDFMFYKNISRQDAASRKIIFINKSKFDLTRRKFGYDISQDKTTRKLYEDNKKLFDETQKMFRNMSKKDFNQEKFIKDMSKFEATRKIFIHSISSKRYNGIRALFKKMLQENKIHLEVFLNVISRQDKEIRIKFTKDMSRQDEATRKRFTKMLTEAENSRKVFLKETLQDVDSQNKFINCLSRQDETSRKMFIKEMSQQETQKMFLNALSKRDKSTRGMFLKDLTQQGPASRKKYFKVMSEQDEMLKIFIENMSEYEATQKMFQKEMSLFDAATRKILKDALLQLDVSIQNKFPNDLSNLNKNSPKDYLNYPFIEGNQAHGIIIVNKKFTGKQSQNAKRKFYFGRQKESEVYPVREGAEKDSENLKHIYDKFNIDYKDNDHFNVDGKAMIEKLESFADNVSAESPVIFISLASHGGSEGIIGTDGKGLTMTEIVKTFTENENLLGIPKVFLIQACRDKNMDVLYNEGDDKAIKKGKHITTKISDVLIAYATSNGTKAFRDKDGSWFFQELRKCVSNELYEDLHFQELLTICSDQLIDECVDGKSQSLTETPSYDSTLRKFLKFPQKQSQGQD